MHLKGSGWIKVFKTGAKVGSFEYWATSQLDRTLQEGAFRALDAWQIEVYHRGLKHHTALERGQFRLLVAQKKSQPLFVWKSIAGKLTSCGLKPNKSSSNRLYGLTPKNPAYILSSTA